MTGSRPRSPISTAPMPPIQRSAPTPAALADEAAAANGDIAQLVAIEDRFGFSSDLPGGQCGYSFASAERAIEHI